MRARCKARSTTGALAIASVAAVAITLALLLAPGLRQNGAATAIASGIALGFASLYTKPLADGLAAAPDLAALAAVLLASPYTYLTIVTNVAGLVMLQNSFAMGRGIIAMPLSSAISNVIPIAGGIAVFGEGFRVNHSPRRCARAHSSDHRGQRGARRWRPRRRGLPLTDHLTDH